jgi:hypothetical protein
MTAPVLSSTVMLVVLQQVKAGGVSSCAGEAAHYVSPGSNHYSRVSAHCAVASVTTSYWRMCYAGLGRQGP